MGNYFIILLSCSKEHNRVRNFTVCKTKKLQKIFIGQDKPRQKEKFFAFSRNTKFHLQFQLQYNDQFIETPEIFQHLLLL